tara:strand:+ start:31404 stop:32855 length:1452 start_codon:yes stop_codon:yes gene_type:complete
MTTKKDNFEIRKDKLGEGLEESLGVPQQGQQDATGSYPSRDYNFGSSINKASRGTKVNELFIGGGDFGVPLGITPQRPSQYPYNQVQETSSGHVIELDDTPGGERVLLKHRKGAGVEVRADGSVVISAVNNKVEVTGGDQTVIIEGHGNLIYQGNLNLKVSGDYNVDVGGNYNVNVAGNKETTIKDNNRTTVLKNVQYTTHGTRTHKTIGDNVNLMLADNVQAVNGNQANLVEGTIDMASEVSMHLSSKESLVAISKSTNLTGVNNVSVMGQAGSIGGKTVDFTGRVYMGNEGETAELSGAIFHGTFKGIADEAVESYNANVAGFAEVADLAHSQSYGEAATSGSTVGTTHVAADKTQASITGKAPITPPDVVDFGTTGTYAIKTVVVDAGDRILNSITHTDDYNDVFRFVPTNQEIRSALRSPVNRDDVASRLVAEGKLNPKYNSKIPPKVGRTASGKTKAKRFGFTPLGNSIQNRGKRFTT